MRKLKQLKELFKDVLESLNTLEIFIGVEMLLVLLFMGFWVLNQLSGTKQTKTESYTVVFLETKQQIDKVKARNEWQGTDFELPVFDVVHDKK